MFSDKYLAFDDFYLFIYQVFVAKYSIENVVLKCAQNQIDIPGFSGVK